MLARLLALAAIALPTVVSAGQWTPLNFTQAITMSIAFRDPLNGFIAGADNGIGADALVTTDGGNTWEYLTMHGHTSFNLGVATAGPKNAVVVGLGILSGGTQYTTNGLNFTNSSMPHVSFQQTQSVSYIGNNPEAVAIPGAFSFFGKPTVFNMVAYSFDSGASFKFANIGGSEDMPVRFGAFPSEQISVVVGGNFPDNGATSRVMPLSHRVRMNIHHKHHPSLTFNHKYQSAPVTPNPGPPTGPDEQGYNGQIWRSVDGFNSFQLVYNTTDFYFNQISCPSVNVCYTVAENNDDSFVLKTSDSGATWDIIYTIPNVSLMTCNAPTEDHVVVAGGFLQPNNITGYTYSSKDGGANWSLTSLPGYYVLDMSIPTPDSGFIAAMNPESQCGILSYSE